MARAGQRKCLCCEAFFDPDRRNRQRQRYCALPACRHASKVASQASWLSQPGNQNYFRDAVHVARVQAWRAAHPGYGRGRVRPGLALQDRLVTQPADLIEENGKRTEPDEMPLQDLFPSLSPLLVGLIAHLFEATLQDDIAATTRRLVQLGRDVIDGGQRANDQAGAGCAAAAAGAEAVQLD